MKSDTTLAKLHAVLQCVMGWQGAHLHQFTIHGKHYGTLDEDEAETNPPLDERNYRLSEVISSGQFEYQYDFGDNWEHRLEIEKTCSPEENVRYPVCMDGARACPPEDVGGIPGYESFLEAIKNPKHPEYKNCREWIGGSFDPEAFDLDEVNRLLRARQ